MAREDYEELLLPYQDSDLEGLLTSHTRKILLGGDYEIHIIRTNLPLRSAMVGCVFS